MRRTTWWVLMVGLLVAATSLAPTAVADDGLGEPPAGAAFADEPVAPAAAAPAEEQPAPPAAPVPVEEMPGPVPPMPPAPPAEIEEPTAEATATETVPLTAAEPLGVEPVPPAQPTVPPTWTGERVVVPSYSAATAARVMSPRRAADLCCVPKDPCGWALDFCGQPYGRWEVLIEGAFSRLECPTGTLGESVPPGTPAYDWGEISYDGSAGGRLSVSFRPGPRDRIELRGGYLGKWDGTSNQTGAFGFSPPLGGVSATGPAILESEAELYGGELNYWRELCCRGKWRFDLGLGLRYVQFDETATLRGLPLPTGAGSAYLNSDVSNQFFAGQIGAAGTWAISRRFELSLIGKLMLGAASRETEVNDISMLAGGPHASSMDSTEFGWGGEVEARVLFRLTPWLGVTAGAAMLYVGEAGRAQDAFGFTQAGTGAVQARQPAGDVFALTGLVGLHLNF